MGVLEPTTAIATAPQESIHSFLLPQGRRRKGEKEREEEKKRGIARERGRMKEEEDKWGP